MVSSQRSRENRLSKIRWLKRNQWLHLTKKIQLQTWNQQRTPCPPTYKRMVTTNLLCSTVLMLWVVWYHTSIVRTSGLSNQDVMWVFIFVPPPTQSPDNSSAAPEAASGFNDTDLLFAVLFFCLHSLNVMLNLFQFLKRFATTALDLGRSTVRVITSKVIKKVCF